MSAIHRISGDLELLGIQYMGDADSTGTSRTIQLVGAETNIGLTITTKGTGTVQVPSGYEANISSDQDLINRAYANAKVAGIDAGALVTGPGAGQDGYALTYDHATTSYTLTAIATALTFGQGITEAGGTVKIGGEITDAATNITLNAVGVARLRSQYTNASDEAGIAVEATALNANQVTLYGVGGSIRITPTIMQVTAPGTGAMAYVADYRANYTIRTMPDVGYVTDFIAGKSVAANVKAPGAPEDSYVIGWQNSTSKYTLIPFPAPSSGYLTVQDEGTSVTQRSVLNFVGASVSVADSGGKTVVTLSGSGITNGAAANELMKSDGTNATTSGLFVSLAGNLTLGSALIGGSGTINAVNASGNASILLQPQGTGTVDVKVASTLNLGTGVAGGQKSIQAAGTATDIELLLASKGSGRITFGVSIGGYVYPFGISNNTNTVNNVLRINHRTVNTPAAGIGVGIDFETQTTAGGNYEIGSTIESISTDVTVGSEDFDLVFKTMSAGAAAVEKFRVTSDGRLYGKSLHNNAGSVTGTTNQYIASGTYSPTCTITANLDSTPTASAAQWVRVGNVVHVSAIISVNATSATTLTSFRMTLPIASNLGNGDCSGSGSFIVSGGGIVDSVYIYDDVVNDAANFNFYPNTASAGAIVCVFQYVVN